MSGRDHLPPVVYARVTGLTVHQLRRFDTRGYLLPDRVDPRTGRRGYGREQVRDGRLLAGLLVLGMATEAAAKAVAEQDGQAVRAHLDVVDAALTAVRETMPPVDGRHLRYRPSYGEQVITALEPLEGATDTLTAVLRSRTVLARATGRPAGELPSSDEREVGWPDGAVVLLDVPGLLVAPLPAPPGIGRVLHPWPASAGAPPEGFGWAALPVGDWVVTDLADDERGGEPGVVAGAVSDVARVLDDRGPHLWRCVGIAYDGEVRTGSVVIAYQPM